MKKFNLFCILFLMMALLGGCYQQRTNIVINKDDSASLSVKVTTQKNSPIAGLIQGAITNNSKDLKKKGFKVEKIDTDALVGFQMSKSIKDIKTVKMNDLVDNGAFDSKEKNKKFVMVNGNTYSINFTIGDKKQAQPSNENQQLESSMKPDVKFVMTLPEKPTSTNATNVSKDGKTLTWDVDVSGETAIKVTYKKSSFPTAPIAIGAGIVILFGIVFFIIKKRNK